VCAALFAGLAAASGVSETQSVYLLPMAGGLDQYLANRLNGVFRVVTDPKLADAVMTDQLGEAFERKLAELYPPEGAASEEKNEEERPRPVSSFSRGRGTVFLVDLKSRAVIWSGYQKRTTTMPEEMHKTAGRIADQIKKAKQQP
jgi:hypothetical protein